MTSVLTFLLSFRPLSSSSSSRRHDRRPLAYPPVQTVYRWIEGYNQSNHQVLPNVSVLNAMTWPELAHVYHSYVENIQVICHTMVRLGNLKDGGWETCTDPAYKPRQPCIIYSFGYVENIQVICHTMVRLGNLKDGGWETCTDPAYKPRQPCIIYSFGINNDFSFDDEVSKFYGCHVHSFDPSASLLFRRKRLREGAKRPVVFGFYSLRW
ncbi:hypothetical protein ElyMa_002424700 [Elysia marginata]|uniref:Methyltransferase domain-containing protein n=1 Tax=Elysia marginata TaxID=1093978 RepID=A0AAV4GIE0_9GAST|nr:hypothetical protein ElyMa_002424700 [Elysia marginata]